MQTFNAFKFVILCLVPQPSTMTWPSPVNQPLPLFTTKSPSPFVAPTSMANPQSSQFKVFISYGRESTTTKFAKKVHGELYENGYEVFLDEIDMKGGQSYSYVLSDRIKDCNVMIVILSERYSQSDMCRKELIFANKLNKKIVLIKRHDCISAPQVEFLIEDRCWINFFKDEEYDERFIDLITALEEVIAFTKICCLIILVLFPLFSSRKNLDATNYLYELANYFILLCFLVDI